MVTLGFSIHRIKRLSRRLKEGREGDTYASLRLANVSPEYDVLQVHNKSKKEDEDYQNSGEGQREQKHRD
ncbi:hypothetical protein AGOR_G00119660 [Albula goreensis]|uniref:Uncharacterized protein n=1 Tax=Albula goreensis TaxID=1534307 RepID=A0A8T3DHA6_9TELE|nr:hypothetical protein AGOR_G00119660 [Albula goreensis]